MRKLGLGCAALVLACQAEDANPPGASEAGSGPGGSSAGASSGGTGATSGTSTGGSVGGTAGAPQGGAAGSASAGASAGLGGAGGTGGTGAASGSGSGTAGEGGTGGIAGAAGGGAGGAGAGAGGRGGSGGAAGSSGVGGRGGSGGAGGALCATRTGGALIDLSIAGESLRLWFTNAAFITEMEQNVGREAPRQPILDLVDGRDCDPRWTWHANPANPRFAPAQMDTCASWPSDVENDKGTWLNTDWCPEMVQVVRVSRM